VKSLLLICFIAIPFDQDIRPPEGGTPNIFEDQDIKPPEGGTPNIFEAELQTYSRLFVCSIFVL
jgi:hypothetical protein